MIIREGYRITKWYGVSCAGFRCRVLKTGFPRALFKFLQYRESQRNHKAYPAKLFSLLGV